MTNSLDGIIGSTAYDQNNDKIGKIKELYLNDETGSPTWVAVSTGLLSSDSLVPLAGASHDKDKLQVRVSKDAVKNAPHLDAGGHLTADQEQELFRHYGIDPSQSGWDTYGRQQAGAGQQGDAGRHAAAGTAAAGTAGAAGAAGARGETGRAAGRDTQTSRAGAADTTQSRTDRDPSMVRSEERLDVDKQSQEVGKARLRKYVVTEEQSVKVPVSHEEVHVVREPIDDASKVGNAEIGDDSREVTLHADKVNVSKHAEPVERVRLDVDNVQDEQTVTDSVRKERVDIEGADESKKPKTRH